MRFLTLADWAGMVETDWFPKKVKSALFSLSQ